MSLDNGTHVEMVVLLSQQKADDYVEVDLKLDELDLTSEESNQSRALSIMGLNGAERIAEYVSSVNDENVDYSESLAAKEYFSYYHEGFNRRTEDPINSRLNYGYAVVRSTVARKLVATGFHPTFGIHHDSQLNAFNLADDLIEPYRAIVDLVAHNNIASNIQLTKSERRELAHVLHNACFVELNDTPF